MMMKRPRWAQLYEELQQQQQTIDVLQTANKHLQSELALLRLHILQHETLLRGKVGVTEEEFTVALHEILRGKTEINIAPIPSASDASHPLLESVMAEPVEVGGPMPAEVRSIAQPEQSAC